MSVNEKLIAQIAKLEGVSKEKIKKGLSSGEIAIPFNPIHSAVHPMAVGKGLRTKVNANIGTSQDFKDVLTELDKVEVCIENKADAIMDLSVGGDLDEVRSAIINASSVPVGTVPIYQAAVEAGGVDKMTSDIMFRAIEKHAQSGVDFITVHCGVTKKLVNTINRKKRVMDIVSRGGAFLFRWITLTGKENPLFAEYDRLLEIAKKYNVTLSLGDGMRPGCIADAGDDMQIGELKILGGLAKRARRAGVQVIIEGPGHVPLNEIEDQMKIEKKICGNAPFYVLGPLPTDVAPGWDHLTSAIGGALAAGAGADFLCYVTPSEHLGLPDMDDVKNGIIASRIAAHIGDIVKGVKGAAEWDLSMAKARKALNWEKQISLAIDPKTARKIRDSHTGSLQSKTCTMCGKYCSMKVMTDSKKKK
jgi:phosphomethylpyrimidine synthase